MVYRKRFKKQFEKQTKSVQGKFFERLEILLENELNIIIIIFLIF